MIYFNFYIELFIFFQSQRQTLLTFITQRSLLFCLLFSSLWLYFILRDRLIQFIGLTASANMLFDLKNTITSIKNNTCHFSFYLLQSKDNIHYLVNIFFTLDIFYFFCNWTLFIAIIMSLLIIYLKLTCIVKLSIKFSNAIFLFI